MAAQTSMLHIRIDDKLKSEASEALANMGLSLSDAVRIFLTRVIREGGLPAGLASDPEVHDKWFRAKVHEALADSRAGLSHRQAMDEAQAVIDKKRRARA